MTEERQTLQGANKTGDDGGQGAPGGQVGVGGLSSPTTEKKKKARRWTQRPHLSPTPPSGRTTKSRPGSSSQPAEPTVTKAARPFTVSVVRNTEHGGRLCKELEYDEESEKVVSRAAAFLTNGSIKSTDFSSIGDFAAYRKKLGENEALVMGHPIYPNAQIVTQAALGRIPRDKRLEEHIIARDRAHITWAEGRALVMLDLDCPDRFPPEVQSLAPTTPEGWRELLIDCIPALEGVQMAWAPSSSSYIYQGGQELHGPRGQRFYFGIESGVHTPQFAEALHDALVLRDLAWFLVSKSGSRLKRLPFDFAVFHPEHLDFAAPPQCVPPLVWRPQEPIVWNDGGSFLLAKDIVGASVAERRSIEAKLRARRQAKAEEAQIVRREWVEETGRSIALRSGRDHVAGAAVARAAIELGVLLPGFVLTDSEGESVTVAELLEDPEKHHGRRLRDPIEPEYRDDARIAVFLAGDGGNAAIYSHAHGGQKWRCELRVPTVRLGLINQTVDSIRAALEQDHCRLYRNGNTLVSVNEATATLQPLDVEGIGLRLQRQFNVMGLDKKGDWIPKNIPQRDLKALMSEASTVPVPNLVGVVRGPYAHQDGTVADEPGYDPVSQVLYVSDQPYPPIARRAPSIGQAREALQRLWHPVSRFPYETDTDRGVVLAAMLSAVARPSLPIAPGYIIGAHAAGTGKTYLAQAIGALQTGLQVAAAQLPERDEEIRKHVFAALLQGSTYLLYDNAERGSEIDSAVLASLVTGPMIEGRVLGLSSVERRPNRLTVVVTGNNLGLRGDLNRRFLNVRLDAGVEYPWKREFDFHPVSHVLANWVLLRTAALELIQAWLTQGAPAARGASGFPEWDAVVRSAVVWIADFVDTGIGFGDPVVALEEAHEEDPEADTLRAFLHAWFALFADKEMLVREVEDVVNRSDGSLDDLGSGDPAEGSQPSPEENFVEARRAALGPSGDRTSGGQQLGQYLSKHAGRVAGGLRLSKGGHSGGARRWAVSRVKSDSSGDGES